MTLTQVVYCGFCEIFKKTFFVEHLQWLLLFISVQLKIAIRGLSLWTCVTNGTRLQWKTLILWNFLYRNFGKNRLIRFDIIMWSIYCFVSNLLWNESIILDASIKLKVLEYRHLPAFYCNHFVIFYIWKCTLYVIVVSF